MSRIRVINEISVPRDSRVLEKLRKAARAATAAHARRFLSSNRTHLIPAWVPTKSKSFLLAMVASFTPPKSRRISESCSTCAPPISTCRFAHLCRSSPLGSVREQESSPATAGRLSTAFNIRTAEKSAKVTSRREIARRYEDREHERSRGHSVRV